MEHSKAKALAETYKAMLQPFCQRIEIVGSIRREKPETHDIDILCIPLYGYIANKQADLFNSNGKEYKIPGWPVNGFIDTVGSIGQKIKGSPATGKYCQRKITIDEANGEFINFELYICGLDNWGYMMALRTGPAEYSKMLVTKGKALKYEFNGGFVRKYRSSVIIPIYNETDFFKLLQMPYIEPENRI